MSYNFETHAFYHPIEIATSTSNPIIETETATSNHLIETETATSNPLETGKSTANSDLKSLHKFKPKKPKPTLYWAIELDLIIFDNPIIKTNLCLKPHLISNKENHSTLLYVGKKEDDREKVFTDYEGQQCYVYISSFGITDDAMALKVRELKFVDEKFSDMKVPSFALIQHVTLALNKEKKILAKDSIKSLEQNETPFQMVLKGHIKRVF